MPTSIARIMSPAASPARAAASRSTVSQDRGRSAVSRGVSRARGAARTGRARRPALVLPCATDEARAAQTNDSIKRRGRSARRAFRLCTAPGSSAVNRCSMRRCHPCSRTISAGGRDRWSAMFCHTRTRVSCPSSARPSAELWLKRHGKRPRGSLFPLVASPCRRGAAPLTSTSRRSRRGAYRHGCLRLRASARPFGCASGRRPVPSAIAVLGQQTGRERPRPWAAPPSRPDPRGRSRPVCCCRCHVSCRTGAARHDDREPRPQPRVTRHARWRTGEPPDPGQTCM